MVEIEAHAKAYHKTSNDTRQRIVAAFEAGTDPATIAACFSVNSWTVRRILDKYRRTGRANKEQHGGYKPRLLEEEHCEFLRELMAEDATITLELMQEKLCAVSGLDVSVSTIHRAIVGFQYSFKTLKVQVRAAVTDAAKESRREYSRWLMETVIHNRNTVYVDEVGFTVVSRVNRGRAKVGESARLVKPLIRSKNFSVMAAIARTGIVHYEVLDGHGNSERFRQFLHGLQEQCLQMNLRDPIIIMDNVSFHRSAIVLEDMAVLGLNYKFLPPYSPFFNPIENFFSQWKGFVRSQKPRDETELFSAMHKVREVVTASYCNNFVARSNKNCQGCIDGRDEFDN